MSTKQETAGQGSTSEVLGSQHGNWNWDLVCQDTSLTLDKTRHTFFTDFLQRSSWEVRRTGFCHDVIQKYLIFNITLFYINNNKTAILTGWNSRARKCKNRLLVFVIPKQWKGKRQQRCNTKTRENRGIFLFTLLKEIQGKPHPITIGQNFPEGPFDHGHFNAKQSHAYPTYWTFPGTVEFYQLMRLRQPTQPEPENVLMLLPKNSN